MSDSCALKTIEDFNKADNKQLVREINMFTSEDKSKLTLYNISLLSDFRYTPNLRGVRKYLEQTGIKTSLPLTSSDKTNILSMFLGKTWDRETFLKVFSVAGLFDINGNRLAKYLSPNELAGVNKNESLIKELYFKIKKFFPSEANPIEAPFVESNTFLNKNVNNPDIIEDDIKSTYAGVETIEEVENDNPIPILSYMKSKGLLGVPAATELDLDGRNEYYDNFKTKIDFLISDDTDLSIIQESIEQFIRTGDAEHFIEISNSLNNEIGIALDLKTIEGSQEDIKDLLDKLYDFVIAPDRKSMASPLYKAYYKVSPKNALGSTKKASIKDGMIINSKDEQQVFEKHDAILVDYPFTYKKINKKSVQWAVAQIFETEKSFIEDRTVFSGVPNIPFNEENQGDIELVIESNIIKYAKKYNISEELAANKFLYQIPFAQNNVPHPDTVDVSKFITTLFKELPNNGKNIFALRRDGTLYMRGQGEYTKKLLELSLSESTFKDMVSYANVSMEPSMSHLREVKQAPSKEDFRNFFVNNPKALFNIDENLIKKVGPSIIALGVKQDFLKVDGVIYEKINDKLGIFEKVDPSGFNSLEPAQILDNKTAEIIIDNMIMVSDTQIIVNKPEKNVLNTTVKNPILKTGVKTLKDFREDYRKYFDKNINIGQNGVFTFEEKLVFLDEVSKLNDILLKEKAFKNYSLLNNFKPLSSNAFELTGLKLNKGYTQSALNRAPIVKIETVPSQTLKELEALPFLTPDQIKDAHSGISDSDVVDRTEEDLDC